MSRDTLVDPLSAPCVFGDSVTNPPPPSAAMSKSIFLFATNEANEYGHSPHCENRAILHE